jgi:hypothetical protein
VEEEYLADRAQLRHLLRQQPSWTKREYAEAVGRSVAWVKKWIKRLRAAPMDAGVLRSRSRAHHGPYPTYAAAVIERILDIRAQPPEHLRRIPGPRAILYYLQRDTALQAAGHRLPRSPTTIWHILHQHGCIAVRSPREHEPLDRPAPLTSWQLDFKDASTVPADPAGGKRQHVVEILNTVDAGTSLFLDCQAREDYTAETSIRAVADLVRQHGVPEAVTFDRDTRFVGSAQDRDFPTPFVRFWLCLGVQVTICPPRRPDKNCYVERLHRSLEYECLRLDKPTTIGEVRAVVATYQEHYNIERPNQARSCKNRPPRTAFPQLPARPSIPLVVDPDRWLEAVDGQTYVRRVKDNGSVRVNGEPYYVSATLAHQAVAVVVVAQTGEFRVLHQGEEVKRLAIKGLLARLVPFDAFVDLLCRQAHDTPPQRSSAPA